MVAPLASLLTRWGRRALITVTLARVLLQRPRAPLKPDDMVIHHADYPLSARLVPLDGAFNFRDVGGYRTSDGRAVGMGLLFRSGALNRLSDADWGQLAQLGVRAVYDLRSDEEIARHPDRLPSHIAYHHLPLQQTDNPLNDRLRLLRHVNRLDSLFQEAYNRSMIDANAPLFGDLLRRWAEPNALPSVVHCTAGKDRTGVAVALLLAALGVSDDLIIADYSLSNLFFPHIALYTQASVQAPLFKRLLPRLGYLLLADPQLMRGALAHIRGRYGSVAGYLQTAAGVDAATVERLRAIFLRESSTSI